MYFRDLLQLSFRSICAQPLRSALTGLGILIGIAAVILLTAIGEGLHRFVLAEFTQFGTHLIAVTPGKATTFGISGATISTVRPLSLADADALGRLEKVEAVVPLVQGNARIESGAKQRRAMVFGVGGNVPRVWSMDVGSGRFLPVEDYQAPRSYAVLGSKLRDELFDHDNPLGQRIRIGGDRYRVIGVMQPKGQMLGFDLDDSIYIPTVRAMELFDREGLMEIDLLYQTGAMVEQLEKNIKRLLIQRHGEEDFTIVTQQQMLETLSSVLDVLTLAVGALGGISLLVGGVGILTIMTIAVSERVSEIGLLRALGAEQGHVLRLFLGEALLLSGTGGVVGVLLAIALARLVAALNPALPIQLAWPYVALALGISLMIGLLAGVVPALRAARLDPLEALRSE